MGQHQELARLGARERLMQDPIWIEARITIPWVPYWGAVDVVARDIPQGVDEWVWHYFFSLVSIFIFISRVPCYGKGWLIIRRTSNAQRATNLSSIFPQQCPASPFPNISSTYHQRRVTVEWTGY